MRENPFWTPVSGFLAKQLDLLFYRAVMFVQMLCTSTEMIYAPFPTRNSVVWLVSALFLGGCTHPVYLVPGVYFNHDLHTIPPSGVAKFESEVSCALMRIDSCTPLSVGRSCVCVILKRLRGCDEGFAEGLCVDVWERYQRFPSQPRSCINTHQVTFPTENPSSLSAVRAGDKQKWTKDNKVPADRANSPEVLQRRRCEDKLWCARSDRKKMHLQRVRSITLSCRWGFHQT